MPLPSKWEKQLKTPHTERPLGLLYCGDRGPSNEHITPKQHEQWPRRVFTPPPQLHILPAIWSPSLRKSLGRSFVLQFRKEYHTGCSAWATMYFSFLASGLQFSYLYLRCGVSASPVDDLTQVNPCLSYFPPVSSLASSLNFPHLSNGLMMPTCATGHVRTPGVARLTDLAQRRQDQRELQLNAAR